MNNTLKALLLTFSTSLFLLGCAGGEESDTQILTDVAKAGEEAEFCDDEDVSPRMVAVINEARAEAQVCRGVQFPATASVTWSGTLRASTDLHADDMANNNFFSHQGTNGSFVDDRATLAGYDFEKVGESLAAGFASPEQTVDAWLASSDGHCENLLDPSFDEVGASCRFNAESLHKTYWAMTMGKSR
jgi:uncharacterized protein YkwD